MNGEPPRNARGRVIDLLSHAHRQLLRRGGELGKRRGDLVNEVALPTQAENVGGPIVDRGAALELGLGALVDRGRRHRARGLRPLLGLVVFGDEPAAEGRALAAEVGAVGYFTRLASGILFVGKIRHCLWVFGPR